ncbi:NADH dehydrogenase (ubiquinone) complex I, assembly factor 6 [Coemansia sp. RSA 2598]|nr:NADH dehydrogenase (ubiquinone) complex I, assembly factor 6 [Coemansia sp. RSA 2598]
MLVRRSIATLRSRNATCLLSSQAQSQIASCKSTTLRYLSVSRAFSSPAIHTPVSKPSDIEYCRRLVQQHDLDNYLVSLFSSRPVREAVWGIRAMNVELVRISEITTSTTAAQMRFAYWHDTIKRLYSDDPMQTPISRCVHDAVRRYSISKTWLRRLVSERERALDSPTFETVADVERYGERAYACLIHPHLEALGVRDMHADNAARAIGVAMAIVNFTRSAPLLLARGRCDLPKDLIAKHQVDLDSLYRNPQSTVELQSAVYEFATKAYTRLCGAAEIYVPSAPRAAFPALMAAVPAKEWLERLESVDFDVFDRRLQQRKMRVLWRLWRASRRGTWIDVSNLSK